MGAPLRTEFVLPELDLCDVETRTYIDEEGDLCLSLLRDTTGVTAVYTAEEAEGLGRKLIELADQLRDLEEEEATVSEVDDPLAVE